MPQVKQNSSLISQTALRAGIRIVEASVQVINLAGTDLNSFVDRNVDATSKDHRESVSSRIGAVTDVPRQMIQVRINVGVRPTKQQVPVRVEPMRAHFDLRTKQVSKKIPIGPSKTARRAVASLAGGNVKGLRVAAITCQFHLQSQVLVKVVSNRAPCSVQAVAIFDICVAGVISRITVIYPQLSPRKFLRQCCNT